MPDGVSCYEGHSGYACSVCEEGYFLMNDRCTSVPNGEYAMIPRAPAALGCWLSRQILLRKRESTSRRRRALQQNADDENGTKK